MSEIRDARFVLFEHLERLEPSLTATCSDRPSMFGGVDSVSLGIFDPAFGHRTEDIGFSGGLRCLFDLLYAIDLKPKMMDTPGESVRIDQREIHKAVGEIDRPVLSPMFFLQSENLLVVLRAFFRVLDVYGNMPDSWSFHKFPSCDSDDLIHLRASSFNNLDFLQPLDMPGERILVLSCV